MMPSAAPAMMPSAALTFRPKKILKNIRRFSGRSQSAPHGQISCPLYYFLNEPLPKTPAMAPSATMAASFMAAAMPSAVMFCSMSRHKLNP